MQEQVNRIKLIDPFTRLELLREYMDRFIEGCQWSFARFIHERHSHLIPDTPEYYKRQATHCYYCDSKLVRGEKNFDHPRRSTIDHYHPKSKGKTEKYVICCADCNTKKDNTSPETVSSKMIRASLRGFTMWGHGGKKLEFIAGKFQQIASDILFNTGPRIYFVKK